MLDTGFVIFGIVVSFCRAAYIEMLAAFIDACYGRTSEGRMGVIGFIIAVVAADVKVPAVSIDASRFPTPGY